MAAVAASETESKVAPTDDVMPVAPFTLLEEADDAEDASDGPALEHVASAELLKAAAEAQEEQEQTLAKLARPAPSSWAAQPPHTVGGPLAYRAMRDALAVQLARRGYDGLRQSALWLVTELAADFLKALGTQLQREAAPLLSQTPSSSAMGSYNPALAPYPYVSVAVVKRMMRHANMTALAEWRTAAAAFTRVAEPAGVQNLGRGPAESRLGLAAPPCVAPLYLAMKGVWNYKLTGSGRQAHSAAASQEFPSAAAAALPPGANGKDLAECLRLSKKQKAHAETWLQAATGTSHTVPVLLPGPWLEGNPNGVGGGGDGAAGGGGGKKAPPRARKGKQQPATVAPAQ